MFRRLSQSFCPMLRRMLPAFGKVAFGASRSRGATSQLLHPCTMESQLEMRNAIRNSGVAPPVASPRPSRHVTRGAQRKALARRKSAAALDRRRTPGGREEIPTQQRLSRNPVAEGTAESVAHAADGGPVSRSRWNLVACRLTVAIIESRCNQLKLGQPRIACHLRRPKISC
jgi:hypothetical protein